MKTSDDDYNVMDSMIKREKSYIFSAAHIDISFSVLISNTCIQDLRQKIIVIKM